jgi:hypothetical protein
MRNNLRGSQVGLNGCRPISTASIMANHCRSSIGRKPATITSVIFRSILMDENGLNAKVGQSIPNLISCGLSTNGAIPSLRTRSRFDLVARRATTISGTSEHQRLGCSAALLLHRDARPPRDAPCRAPRRRGPCSRWLCGRHERGESNGDRHGGERQRSASLRSSASQRGAQMGLVVAFGPVVRSPGAISTKGSYPLG